jgi:hypothetical protein
MIISASRRTDIPAFFSDWFYNRIQEGYVYVRNPMNIHQVSQIDISPNIVDCIVFWTKNSSRFTNRLGLLRDYTYYFQYTITGYGKALEPNVPNAEDSIESFKYLSNKIGSSRVIWRYDPIIITSEYSIKYHLNRFDYIASNLAGYTNKCVISFVDNYKKTLKNMAHIKQDVYLPDKLLLLSNDFVNLGHKYRISIASCAEEIDLSSIGISHGKCIDDKLIEEISGNILDVGKDKNQRDECGCIASIDIGAYNTCPHGCVYCYANYDMNVVRQNYTAHDKSSKLLFGNLGIEDKITKRKVMSCRQIQQSLFGNIEIATSMAQKRKNQSRGIHE